MTSKPQFSKTVLTVAIIIAMVVLFLALWTCLIHLREQEKIMKNSELIVNENQALEIAKTDAMQAYRDLSVYNVKIKLKDDKWYVDYELKEKFMVGGGPHYVISAKTGEILERRYEQ
jgi:hypothetical protein